jgi:hypothetical protein
MALSIIAPLTAMALTPRVMRIGNAVAGLLPERGNCEVYELKDIATQVRH